MKAEDIERRATDPEVQVALEEYRAIWSYYQKTLDERGNLLNWHFKVTALPAAFLGFLAALNERLDSPNLPPILGMALLTIFVTGFWLAWVHAKESANAGNYERALLWIRRFLCKQRPVLCSAVVMQWYRPAPGARIWSIKGLRTSCLVFINAAVGTGALALLIYPTLTSTLTWDWKAILAFIGIWAMLVGMQLVVVHWTLISARALAKKREKELACQLGLAADELEHPENW